MAKTGNLPPISKAAHDNPFSVKYTDRKNNKTTNDEVNMKTTKSIFDKSASNTISRASRLANILGDEAEDLLNSNSSFERSESTYTSEKESTIDLIAKKKEMFLVQMSLDTKREEIRKLEEKAHLKEDALQRSEQMLEEDALRFDAFLKENDKKAHDAIKRAEEETRKKQEKVLEVKRLTQKIQALNTDIAKNKEVLEECLKYKAFLDELTPINWIEEQKQLKASLIESERQRLYEQKYNEWKVKMMEISRQQQQQQQQQNIGGESSLERMNSSSMNQSMTNMSIHSTLSNSNIGNTSIAAITIGGGGGIHSAYNTSRSMISATGGPITATPADHGMGMGMIPSTLMMSASTTMNNNTTTAISDTSYDTITNTTTGTNKSTHQQQLQQPPPAPPKLDDIIIHPEDYYDPYFTTPIQLMEIFTALEEQNLFLIQNCQETEQTLEELKTSYSKSKIVLENQSNILSSQIDTLQNQILSEKQKIDVLSLKKSASTPSSITHGSTMKSNTIRGATSTNTTTNATMGVSGKLGNTNNTTTTTSMKMNTSTSMRDEEIYLQEIHEKIQLVYEQCGFDITSRPTSIVMLSQLENKLETLLMDISKLPNEFVLKAEKEKEKKRREAKREEQQTQLIHQQEERNRRALERSMQTPKKRNGRTIMYRSKLIVNEKKNKESDEDLHNNEELKYMS